MDVCDVCADVCDVCANVCDVCGCVWCVRGCVRCVCGCVWPFKSRLVQITRFTPAKTPHYTRDATSHEWRRENANCSRSLFIWKFEKRPRMIVSWFRLGFRFVHHTCDDTRNPHTTCMMIRRVTHERVMSLICVCQFSPGHSESPARTRGWLYPLLLELPQIPPLPPPPPQDPLRSFLCSSCRVEVRCGCWSVWRDWFIYVTARPYLSCWP